MILYAPLEGAKLVVSRATENNPSFPAEFPTEASPCTQISILLVAILGVIVAAILVAT